MPRLRFLSNDVLDHLRSISSRNAAEDNGDTDHLVDLCERAARWVLNPEEYSELLWVIYTEPALRELALHRRTSAATEMRKRPLQAQQLQRLGTAFIAVQLAASLESKEGVTIDPRTGLPLRRRDGHLVSVNSYGRSFPGRPSIEAIMSWLTEHVTCLASHFPGAWIDRKNGNQCLDMNRWILSREEALSTAQAEEQDAIFDLRNRCDIPVPRRLREEEAA